MFTIFSPWYRYLIVGHRFYPLFPIARGMLPWQPILRLKWAKSADSLLYMALEFLNRVEYRKIVNGSARHIYALNKAHIRKWSHFYCPSEHREPSFHRDHTSSIQPGCIHVCSTEALG